MSDAAAVPPLRLFLALWPGPATRAALMRAQARWAWPAGARPTPAGKLHVTLHFLGAVDAARLPALRSLLDGLCLPPLELRLDRHALWPRGLAVLEALSVPPELLALHADIGAGLRTLGLPVEQRRWRLHVTLARKADQAQPPDDAAPLRWPVRSVALVQSVPGPAGGYRVLARRGAVDRTGDGSGEGGTAG